MVESLFEVLDFFCGGSAEASGSALISGSKTSPDKAEDDCEVGRVEALLWLSAELFLLLAFPIIVRVCMHLANNVGTVRVREGSKQRTQDGKEVGRWRSCFVDKADAED